MAGEGSVLSPLPPIASRARGLEPARMVVRHGPRRGRFSQRSVVHVRRIRRRTVMMVSARSKKALMTVARRS